MKIHNKLVRDKIPEIIEKSGKTCAVHVLSNEEYITELDKKLQEEATEYLQDKNIEEMADLLEVIYAICTARGYTLEELESVRKKKAEERGGFAHKIFLEYVKE